MTKVTRERLEHLILILEDVPDTLFDMSVWSGPECIPKMFPDCGMVGCAGGHAAMDPEFNEMGLKLVEGVPVYKSFAGFDAIQTFFCLTMEQTQYIFNPDFYIVDRVTVISKGVVINRIKDFLSNPAIAKNGGLVNAG